MVIPLEGKVGLVVNYYWPSPSQNGYQIITSVTQLGLMLLRKNHVVGSIVLVDGSPEMDESMRDFCQNLDVNYLHAGRKLGLAEGYNLGWRSLPEQYIGLMANDILPYPSETLQHLYDWIKLDNVGCVFPCLTDFHDCDYPPQLSRFFNKFRIPCEPAVMTLNLNLFKQSVLEEVGGVDEGYLAGFYDPVLVMKIRRAGYRVIQLGDVNVVHLNHLTKTLGGSGLTQEKWKIDHDKFIRENCGYFSQYGIHEMSFWRWPFATSRLASLGWWFVQQFPSYPRLPVISSLEKIMMWIEPLLTRYPTKYGNKEMCSRKCEIEFQITKLFKKIFMLIFFPRKTISQFLRFRKYTRVIKSSNLFDKTWYLNNNPDVLQAKVDPESHYLKYGGFEGRNPGPEFDSSWYLKTYADVKKVNMNPLIHYLLYGKSEGRFPKKPR
jgi:GT2 family glycosyltransferase